MMKNIYSFIAMAIFILGFGSCQKENLDINGNIKVPDNTDVMQLDRWSYEIPLTIESNSEWEIEIDGEFCYTDITEGSGTTTVKLCITDNATDEKQKGSLTVVFPKDPSKNYTLNLQQKCSADYGDNADNITVGNRIYAVGYGYDISGEYASPNSVQLPQIIQFKKAQDDNLIHFGSVTASYEAKTFSGSSVTEISNQLNSNANFGGKLFGFSGEIGATFDMKSFSNNNNEYAISYVEVALKDVFIETNIVTLREEYLTPSAYRAINGINKKGEPSVTYPSTDEGFKALIKEYGTHLIMKARLGGKMKYSLVTDVSKVEGEYNLTAFANANYKNKYVHTSVSVSDTYKNSFKKNSSACTSKLQILGGDTQKALNLSNADSDGNVEAWKNSLVEGKNLALVGLDLQKGLIPLYELVDKEDYPEREAALKAYMTGTKITEDIKSVQMEYDCGTVTKIDIPIFDQSGTLVKDIYSGGQCVAQICEEYIPVINKKNRVRVIYPVLSNKTKFNMGYFVGDAAHRPARVCWEDQSLTVTEYDKNFISSNKVVYLRGSAFSNSSNDKIVDGTTEGSYVLMPTKYETNYKCPIVKIFNHIWTKADSQIAPPNGNYYQMPGYSMLFYNVKDYKAYNNIPPKGWDLPSTEDYKSIEKTLLDNNVTHITIVKAFMDSESGGVLGYDAAFSGMYYPRFNEHHYNEEACMVGCREGSMDDETPYIFIMKTDGSFYEQSIDAFRGGYFPLRFIKEIK